MNCGTKLPDEAKFCFKCGFKVTIAEEDNVNESKANDDNLNKLTVDSDSLNISDDKNLEKNEVVDNEGKSPMYEAGLFFENNPNLPEDDRYAEAYKYFKMAADAGDERAISKLKYYTEDGHYILQNNKIYKERKETYFSKKDKVQNRKLGNKKRATQLTPNGRKNSNSFQMQTPSSTSYQTQSSSSTPTPTPKPTPEPSSIPVSETKEEKYERMKRKVKKELISLLNDHLCEFENEPDCYLYDNIPDSELEFAHKTYLQNYIKKEDIVLLVNKKHGYFTADKLTLGVAVTVYGLCCSSANTDFKPVHYGSIKGVEIEANEEGRLELFFKLYSTLVLIFFDWKQGNVVWDNLCYMFNELAKLSGMFEQGQSQAYDYVIDNYLRMTDYINLQVKSLNSKSVGTNLHGYEEATMRSKFETVYNMLKQLRLRNGQYAIEGIRDTYFYPDIPSKKISNVLSSYARNYGIKPGDILMLSDNTLFGSAKDGAIFTTKGIIASEDGKLMEWDKIQRLKYDNFSYVTAVPFKVHVCQQWCDDDHPGMVIMYQLINKYVCENGSEVYSSQYV